jgi:hypothetical protein
MKKLLMTLIGVAALALAAVQNVDAQTPNYGNTAIVTSATYASGVTNLATPQAFFVGDRRHVGIQWTLGAGAANTNIAAFALSDDALAFDTNTVAPTSFISLTNVNSAAGNVTRCYDIDTQGHGYLEYFQMNCGTATTTNSLKRSIKISAP